MRIEIIKDAKPVKMFNRYNRKFYVGEVIDVDAEAEKQIEMPSGFLGSALPLGKDKRLIELGIAKMVSPAAKLKSAEDIVAERKAAEEAEIIKFEAEKAALADKADKEAKKAAAIEAKKAAAEAN